MSELQHYGIQGMKWGVRRYQNEDGTLTSAGKARYKDDEKSKTVDELKKEYGKLEDQMTYGKHADKKKNASLEKRMKEIEDLMNSKKTTSAHEDHTKARDKKKVSEMSDKELRDRLNRLDMERRYNQLNPGTVSKGKDYLNKTIKVGTTVATVTTTALTIYNNYNKIAEILNKRKG